MIRYIWLVINAIIIAAIFLLEYVTRRSFSFAFPWIGTGLLLALPIGVLLARLFYLKLVLKRSFYFDRHSSEGVALMFVAGFVIVAIAKYIEAKVSTNLALILTITFFAMLTSIFVFLGCYIFVLEKKYNKKVYLGVTNGLFFDK